MNDQLRVFTAFSGYDSQCMALDRLGIDYDLVGWSEIEKNAIEAHNAVYPQWADRNYGDISKIDWMKVPDFDLFTYSSPCQDISIAGYQKGLTEGSGTRSSLLWECKKAIEAKKPKYLLMENVKALTSKKFKPYLDKWLEYLRELGYSNYTKVLNAKNYGIPQNRERVFVVSILGDEMFYFPEEMKLEIFLNDILEDNVDERYYLKKKTIENAKINPSQLKYGNKRVQSLVDSGKIAQDKIVFIDAYNQSVSDLRGTIRTTISTSNMMFITEPITCAMRGRNVENPSDRRPGISTQQMIEMGGNIANCITTVQKNSLVIEPKGRIIAEPSIQAYRIRKLTERECFRLMGVSEENIDKIQSSNVSKARQYKLAGNSIVVNVLYHIFRKMFIDKNLDKNQLLLFN